MGRAYAKDVSPSCSRYWLKWNINNRDIGELTTRTMGRPCGEQLGGVRQRRRHHAHLSR